jgi:hypothetical protein
MMSKHILSFLTLALLILLPAAARTDEGACPDTDYSIAAFGGEFRVPNYLRLVVNLNDDHAVGIRMIRKLDEVGSIKLISITRNGKPERRANSLLKQVDRYELNGFDVQIFQSSDPDIGWNLFAAQIERGGETAHIIVDSLEALDALLADAETLDAENMD